MKYTFEIKDENYLAHYGIKGMKWRKRKRIKNTAAIIEENIERKNKRRESLIGTSSGVRTMTKGKDGTIRAKIRNTEYDRTITSDPNSKWATNFINAESQLNRRLRGEAEAIAKKKKKKK